MANQRPRYDDKFRASAVVMLQAAGYPDREGALSQVAGHLDIHRETLRRWATEQSNPPPPEIVTEKKIELSELLDKEIHAALGEMDKARPGASYRDLGTVAAILIDKRQLLNDKPTQNVNAQINFVRTGVSTLPEHLAPGAVASTTTEETV